MENVTKYAIEDSSDARRFFNEIHEHNIPALQSASESTRNKRVAKELRMMMRADTVAADYVTCRPVPDTDVRQFVCSMLGPAQSPYEMGIFHLMLVLPERYPNDPPFCRFLTKVYHPDFASNGSFHCDVLEASWCPALTIEKILITIISMLTEVSPCESLAPEVAATLAQDAELYEINARSLTRKNATKGPPMVEEARAVGDLMLREYPSRWAAILRAVER